MPVAVNQTHDPALKSWVESANDPATDFPIQNLPFGVYRHRGALPGMISIGVAIGDQILDISTAQSNGLFDGDAAEAAKRCGSSMLHSFLAMGRLHWRALRFQLVRALRADTQQGRRASKIEGLLVPQAEVEMTKPAYIGDFTDFFACLNHARNATAILQPGADVTANYKWMPLAYHGRGSSIVLSGAGVRRPAGVWQPDGAPAPVYAPTQKLDYELELGFLIGKGNEHGRPVTVAAADEHLFGVCLLNDWSARDIQRWESRPLGPFLGKSFATTMSPWIVTMEALAPFRTAAHPRAADDPPPLHHLFDDADQHAGGLDMTVEAWLSTARMREQGFPSVQLSTANASELFWTPAQMLAHHTSNGCNMRYGDLLGSGTISGETPDTGGCLLERTRDGAQPLALPTGETRAYLEDGDTVTLRAYCQRPGYRRIGLGECSGTVVAAADNSGS